MHSIPAAYQNAWDRAVNDLEPFTFHVMVFRGTDYDPALEDQNGQYSGTPFYMLLAGDFVSCISTKTLYETMTFGECASSELNAQLLTRLSSISHTGRKWTNPTLYTPAIDDQWVVQITPLSLTTGGNGATSPFWVTHGVYYVSDLQTDTTTGITSIKAVDVLSKYGQEVISTNTQEGPLYTGDPSNMGYLDLALAKIGVSLPGMNGNEYDSGSQYREKNSGHPRELHSAAAVWFGYWASGYTAREFVGLVASTYRSNAIVSDNNVLKILFFNYPALSPIRIGYRAEAIAVDGIYEKYHLVVETPPCHTNIFTNPLPSQNYNTTRSEVYTTHIDTGTAYGQWSTHRSEPAAAKGVGGADVHALSFKEYSSHYARSMHENGQDGKYYAFTATNIVADPALELGDTVSLLNKGDGSGCLADEFLATLIFPDGTRIKLDLPHDDQTWWEKQTEETQVVGIISKLIIDYRMPQIAQTLQSAANR